MWSLNQNFKQFCDCGASGGGTICGLLNIQAIEIIIYKFMLHCYMGFVWVCSYIQKDPYLFLSWLLVQNSKTRALPNSKLSSICHFPTGQSTESSQLLEGQQIYHVSNMTARKLWCMHEFFVPTKLVLHLANPLLNSNWTHYLAQLGNGQGVNERVWKLFSQLHTSNTTSEAIYQGKSICHWF